MGYEVMEVTIYSDGSSRGNPGPGGYGTVLRCVDPSGRIRQKELMCGYRRTTNNRMELLGAIKGLEALKRPCKVELYTDSRYVVNPFNEKWIYGWIRNGWKTASKKPVKNIDLWKRLLEAAKPHDVTYHWVEGHVGHDLNELCDMLATESADGKHGPLLEDEGFDGSC